MYKYFINIIITNDMGHAKYYILHLRGSTVYSVHPNRLSTFETDGMVYYYIGIRNVQQVCSRRELLHSKRVCIHGDGRHWQAS